MSNTDDRHRSGFWPSNNLLQWPYVNTPVYLWGSKKRVRWIRGQAERAPAPRQLGRSCRGEEGGGVDSSAGYAFSCSYPWRKERGARLRNVHLRPGLQG